MILEVSWDNLWTLSFGLSQFHSHGSWLVCEVVLNQNPSVHKFNRLHVVICWVLGYLFEAYSFDSIKGMGPFSESWTSTGYFSNSTVSSVTRGRFSPFIVEKVKGCSSFPIIFGARTNMSFIVRMKIRMLIPRPNSRHNWGDYMTI